MQQDHNMVCHAFCFHLIFILSFGFHDNVVLNEESKDVLERMTSSWMTGIAGMHGNSGPGIFAKSGVLGRKQRLG